MIWFSSLSLSSLKHRSRHPTSYWAATVVLLLSSLVAAQSFRGSIRGKVLDPAGSVISGAKITVKNNATGLNRTTATGDDGGYVLAELPAGVYAVTAEASGFSPVAQNVTVNVGLDTNAEFDLTRIERTLQEITVSGAAPLVETTRDVLGEVVDQKL